MVVKNLQSAKEDGKIVIWTKPSSGDQMVPYLDPDDNITVVDFYSGWDYYGPLPGFPQVININHSSIPVDTGVTFGTTHSFITNYVVMTTNIYNLGPHGGDGSFIPGLFVSINGVQYPQGAVIQTNSAAGRRMVSFYCDATNIYVYESCRGGPSGLPAITVSYRVTPFRNNIDVPGEPLLDADILIGKRIRMGKGRIDTDFPVPMREAIVGDTNILSLPAAETMDVRNGRFRMALSDGTIQDLGPLVGLSAYNGSFSPPIGKQVVV